MTADQLEQEVLKLPKERRVRLAERILASLDDGTEIEPALIREVKRRVRELGAATVTPPPGPDDGFGLVGFQLQSDALHAFIAAWKMERSDEEASSDNR